MSGYTAENDVHCCACTNVGIAFVIDGTHHKPVCDQHGRMYREQGYQITGGPSVTLVAEFEALDGSDQ